MFGCNGVEGVQRDEGKSGADGEAGHGSPAGPAAPVEEASAAAGNSEQVAFADALVGHYRWTGDPAEKAAVERAVESVVEEMSVFVRDLARTRLTQATRIPAAIGIARTRDHLEIAFDERKYKGPLDGRAVEVEGIDGEMLRHRVELGPFGLLQSFHGENGRRRNALKLHGERGLVVVVEIESEQLPKRLSYRLTFERAR